MRVFTCCCYLGVDVETLIAFHKINDHEADVSNPSSNCEHLTWLPNCANTYT